MIVVLDLNSGLEVWIEKGEFGGIRIGIWMRIVMVLLRIICGNVLWEYSLEFWIEQGKLGGGFGHGCGWIVMVILGER